MTSLRVASSVWRRSISTRKVDVMSTRKVDVRLPGLGNSNSHGARPVHLIITMIKWIRTSRLSIKNWGCGVDLVEGGELGVEVQFSI